MTHNHYLKYEYPLTEKMRVLLRMENILRSIHYFKESSNAHELSQVVCGWVSLAQLFERTDIKQELTKDLEKEAQQLTQFFSVPNVDHQKLDDFLSLIDSAQSSLKNLTDKRSLIPGDFLFKEACKKSILPGSFNAFDAPFLYQWLQCSPCPTEAPLKSWELSFQPITKALQIYLQLLRGQIRFEHLTIQKGEYTQSLTQAGEKQLILLKLPQNVVPEMSTSRYQFHLRCFKASVHEPGNLVDSSLDIEIGYR